MRGFQPEKFKGQHQGDAPKLGFKPRKSAPPGGSTTQQPSSAGLVRGFDPHYDAARAQALNQAPDSIPAMVKPGEFVLPPDTVHAMGGPQALQGVVDATHTPAPDVAVVPRGFEPRVFFAQGGLADEETARRRAAAGAPGLAVDTSPQNAARFAQVPPGIGQQPAQANSEVSARGLPAPRAAAPASPAAASPSIASPRAPAGQSEYGRQMSSLGQALLNVPKHIVSAPGYGLNSDMRRSGEAQDAFAQRRAGSDLSPGQRPLPAAVTPSSAGAGRGTVNPPLADPTAPASVPAPAAAPPSTGNVTRVGNSYSGTNVSGDITVNGQAPAGGFMVADAPQARGFQPGMAAVAAAPAVRLGFRPGMGSPAPSSAPRLGFQPGMMAAADALADRSQAESMGRLMASGQIAAPAAGPSLIMSGNTGFRRDGRFLAQELGAQRALERAQGRDPASLRRAAELQRAALQEQGANQRAALGFQTEQQRLGIEGRRADSEVEARGFQTRAAREAERFRAILLDPKSTAGAKAEAQQALRLLSGDGDRWKPVALQGGTDAQGNKTESILGAVNERTGEMKRMDGQGGAKLGPVSITNDESGRRAFAALPNGAEFVGPDGKTYRKG